MDENGILAAVFDRTNKRLTTTAVVASSTAPTTARQSDANGVWLGAYDSATKSLRVVFV